MKNNLGTKRIGLLLCFSVFLVFNAQSQIRLAVYQMQVNRSSSSSLFTLATTGNDKSKMQVVPQNIISYFSNDPDFTIIDRKNQDLIKDEKDLQKSEEFIDGYIVEQGQAEGADMICTSFYDESSKALIIKIFDVSTGKMFCSRERQMKTHWLTGLKSLEKEVTIMLHEISATCFDKGFPVVRVTSEKKGKAKEILVLAGFAQRIKLDYKIEIYKNIEENIGGVKRMRKQKVGEGFVSRIEDDNFSTITLNSGKKEVFEDLKNGIELQCKLISRK